VGSRDAWRGCATLRRPIMPPRRKPTTRSTSAHATPLTPADFPPASVHTGVDAAQIRAQGGEIERLRFVGCELAGADLSRLRFEDCLFERCNLASVKLSGTALRNVAFVDCKLLGAVFADCDDMLFSVGFTECQLRYASFVGRRMAGTSFTRCALPDADFSEADLSQATFDECDLARAIFHRTRLLGADFTTAIDFSLDPELNALEGARFALRGLPGLLVKYGVVVE